MARLYQWFLERYTSGKMILHGVVTGHDKLPDSWFVHTTNILSISQGENPEQFIFQTQNTSYHCSMENCNYERCRTALAETCGDASVPGYEEWAARFEEFALQYNNMGKEDPQAEDGTVLLCLGTNREFYFGSMDVNPGNGGHLKCYMHPHIGTFQDSVLCQSIDRECDLRYFPHRNGNLEFYHWEPQNLPVYIENCGDGELRVACEGNVYVIPAGERTLIDPAFASPSQSLTSHQDLYDAFDHSVPKVSIDSVECEVDIRN